MLLARPESHDVLVALVTAVLRPPSPVTKVTVLNPEIPKESVLDKGIVLDLVVELGDGTRLNIEMQAHKRAGFRSRVLYYWARLYSSQLHRGENYQELLKVVSILFLDYKELSIGRLHSVFKLLEIHNRQPFSSDVEVHVIELPRLDRIIHERWEGGMICCEFKANR